MLYCRCSTVVDRESVLQITKQSNTRLNNVVALDYIFERYCVQRFKVAPLCNCEKFGACLLVIQSDY